MSEWTKVEDALPNYYDLIWASDGVAVVLSMLVGRSSTPQKQIFKNVERIGCDELVGITMWMPAIRPTPPRMDER